MASTTPAATPAGASRDGANPPARRASVAADLPPSSQRLRGRRPSSPRPRPRPQVRHRRGGPQPHDQGCRDHWSPRRSAARRQHPPRGAPGRHRRDPQRLLDSLRRRRPRRRRHRLPTPGHRHLHPGDGNRVSLVSASWVPVARTKGSTWDRPGRPRHDRHPTVDKVRWHAARPNLATILDLPR